jgi:thiol:disulfide interchange protein
MAESPTHSASPSTSPRSSASPSSSARHGLTQIQRDALATALATYKAAIQSALDGAHKAIADAQSIRDQAFAAAPKDKNVRALANADFARSSTQIWDAFKSSTAAAKATYEAAINTIKSTR